MLVGGIGSLAAGATLTSIGYLLINLEKDFKLTPFAASMLPACSSFAQTVGALLWGVLADRVGRRPVFTANLLLSSIALIVAAAAQSWSSFVLCITLSMLGLGGFTTLDLAIAVEFMPNKWRPLAVMILTSSW